MVAHTYQLSLFSIVVLIIIGFLVVLTIVNWTQRLLLWLSGSVKRTSKSNAKEDQIKSEIQTDVKNV